MAGPVFYESVAEWSMTSGTTRPYQLGGAVPGSRTLLDAVADGDWGYFSVSDGVRWETVQGRFQAPGTLTVIATLASSNGGAPVVWPAANRRTVRLVPPNTTEAYGLLLAEMAFWAAIEAGTITDLGVLPDNPDFWAAVASGALVDFGDLSEGTITGVDLGALDGTGDGLFTADFGELPDGAAILPNQSLTPINMGDLVAGGDDLLLTLDLGEIADLSAEIESTNAALFWMVLGMGGVVDLGDLSDQVINPIDAGDLAALAGIGRIDLGEMS